MRRQLHVCPEQRASTCACAAHNAHNHNAFVATRSGSRGPGFHILVASPSSSHIEASFGSPACTSSEPTRTQEPTALLRHCVQRCSLGSYHARGSGADNSGESCILARQVLEPDAEHSNRIAEKGAACPTKSGQACWERVRQYDGMRRRLTSSEDCLPNKLLVESYGPRMRTGVPRRFAYATRTCGGCALRVSFGNGLAHGHVTRK